MCFSWWSESGHRGRCVWCDVYRKELFLNLGATVLKELTEIDLHWKPEDGWQSSEEWILEEVCSRSNEQKPQTGFETELVCFFGNDRPVHNNVQEFKVLLTLLGIIVHLLVTRDGSYFFVCLFWLGHPKSTKVGRNLNKVQNANEGPLNSLACFVLLFSLPPLSSSVTFYLSDKNYSMSRDISCLSTTYTGVI